MNSALRLVGLGLYRLEVPNRLRRATQAGAFEQLKRLGFDPRTVIDVGVAHGTPALYQAFPDARHLLIEPVEECTPFLEAIARQFRQVEYILAAAARHPGRSMINVHRDVNLSSTFWQSDYRRDDVTTREVRAIAIDQVRLERSLEPPFLLKIDVEGAELDVLAGAAETLKDSEYVLLEVSLFEFFKGAPLIAAVVEYMNRQGFVIYDVVSLMYRPLDGALSMVELGFVKAAGRFRGEHRFDRLPTP